MTSVRYLLVSWKDLALYVLQLKLPSEEKQVKTSQNISFPIQESKFRLRLLKIITYIQVTCKYSVLFPPYIVAVIAGDFICLYIKHFKEKPDNQVKIHLESAFLKH